MNQGLANRSLDRGITVMEMLAREGASSLADLHRHTDLPKSTLRRLLATLIDRRIVRKSLGDGYFRLNITLPISAGTPVPPHLSLLIDAAVKPLEELTGEVGWPSDLHLLDGRKMRIIDSTRPQSAYHLYKNAMNRAVNIFGSASGVACLAAMPEGKVREIYEATRDNVVWGLARFSMAYDDFCKLLEKTGKQGYATRLSNYVGETFLDDNLSAIAMPIKKSSEVIGAGTLIWPRNFMQADRFAALHAATLHAKVQEIEERLML